MNIGQQLISKGRQEGRQEAERRMAEQLLRNGVNPSLVKATTHLTDADMRDIPK